MAVVVGLSVRNKEGTPMETTFAVCTSCGQDAVYFARNCGANVCDHCGAHQRLVRCFCGWAASGGDGYRELLECGEVIEEE